VVADHAACASYSRSSCQSPQPRRLSMGTHDLSQVRVDFPFRLNGATNVVVTSNALALLGAPYMNAQFAWIGQL
jgi:hypothetical protein